MVIYKNYINGKWVASGSKETFDSLNPASDKLIGKFQKSRKEDVERAVVSARKAFGSWRDTPAPTRAKYLWKVVELLKKDKERLAKLIVEEMGKVISEARGDVQEAIDIFEYMAGEGRRLLGHTTKSELPNKFAMTVRNPVGVVGLVTPWNFPIAIPSWKAAPALICGNCVVWKPSSDIPLLGVEFTKILEKAGLPNGVFNMVTGEGSRVGGAIIRHKDVYGISFTGSKATGEWILKEAGIKKVGLELGGKNVIIVMDDANLDLAVDGILFGAFGTTGQRCTASSRVIVHQKVKRALEKKLVKRTLKLKVGNGMKADVGPLINHAAVEKVQKYVSLGKREGARLLVGGKRMLGKGNYYAPTIFTDCKREMRICQEEIFGPVLSILPVKDFEEAVSVANDVEYGLSSAIYTADISKAFRAIEVLQTGITYINSSTIGAEVHLPFGGVKGTGNGTREAGIEGIHEFSETKAVYVDYSGKLQKAQIDT